MIPSEQLLDYLFQRIKLLSTSELKTYDIKVFPDIMSYTPSILTRIFVEDGVTVTWRIEISEWSKGHYTLHDSFTIKSRDVFVQNGLEVNKYITELAVCKMLIYRIQDTELYELIENWRGY